jgi:hypothetical protein
MHALTESRSPSSSLIFDWNISGAQHRPIGKHLYLNFTELGYDGS